MKLKKYRITGFRSIIDSGDIDCEESVTTLVGINESGKSNVLLALFKLKPADAKFGEINLLKDMPRKYYSLWNNEPSKHTFVSASFDMDEIEFQDLEKQFYISREDFKELTVSRTYDGKYSVEFSGLSRSNDISCEDILSKINNWIQHNELNLDAFKDILKIPEEKKIFIWKEIQKIISDIVSKKQSLSVNDDMIEDLKKDLSIKLYPDKQILNEYIISKIPCFVYYSEYGNLSSRIDLQPIDNVSNEKTRTINVLFKYTGLDPKEIYRLGHTDNIKDCKAFDTPESKSDKEKRDALLNSAATILSEGFKEWWKQGEYKFNFHVDGNYFQILVSDNKRPDMIDLDERSTGLKWFLSFFLVFIIETGQKSKDAVLLLDEAGLTLHPLSQRDLLAFFNELSERNQVIHTTHSPFLVDMNDIGRVRAVYSDNNGNTIVSSDLKKSDISRKSIYAIHAALDLSVSDVMFMGCKKIIVEGVSDQHYLNSIRNYLLREGLVSFKQDMVFVPSGGAKGVKGIVSMICAGDEDLPIVLLDSDQGGKETKRVLLSGLYSGNESKILEVGKYTGMIDSEIEDLIPTEIMIKNIDKIVSHHDEESFEDNFKAGISITPQMEEFGSRFNMDKLTLKVKLSERFRNQISGKNSPNIDKKYVDKWKLLFEDLENSDLQSLI